MSHSHNNGLPPEPGESYASRDKLLLKMGFASYAHYRDSELWRTIRSLAYIRHGKLCKICKRPATEIHHLNYTLDVLLGRNLRLLAPICEACHMAVEFGPDGKRMLWQARKAYGTLKNKADRARRGLKTGWTRKKRT